jgi:energy-coupling factor transporter ATP-binding protein EcfA2
LKVEDELNRRRLDRIVELLELKPLLDRNVMQLSGGEKQRVILGSVLMMKPEILILDEPLAYLDGPGRLELLHHISKLRTKFREQLTILIAEHRLHEVLPLANKFILLDQGKTEFYSNINEIHTDFFAESFQPAVEQTYASITPANFSYDSTIRKFGFKPKDEISKEELDSSKNNAGLSFETVSFDYVQDMGKYNRQVKRIFDEISFKIFPGDIIGVVGSNGSGKTTLLYLIAGILRPSEGKIYYKNEDLEGIPYFKHARNIGLIFQNPESQLLKSTITKELEFGPKNFGLGEHLNKELIEESLNLIFSSEERVLRNKFGQEPLAELNPFNLSWGQKRRLNLASLYTYSPSIYLLDEPFTGQDVHRRKEIMTTLLKIIGDDKIAIISTHDEEILQLCTTVFLIENKKLKIYRKKED